VTTAADWDTLAERFGLGPPRGTPRYVTRGAMGEIWRLETGLGRWAVKWLYPWSPDDPRPADLPVQQAAARAGLPLPRPVTTADGDGVIQVGGRPARVYAWADLDPQLSAPVPVRAAAEAGRLLGLLHALALPADGPADPWYTDPPEPASWPDLIARAQRAGAPWAGDLAAAQPLIADLTARTGPQDGPLITCHRDYHPGNVFPRTGRERELIVLDWENCGPLDPRREFAEAVLEWCYGHGPGRTADDQAFDADAARALAAGYSRAAAAQPRLDESCFGTSIAARVNLLAVMADQALADPQHRAFAEERVTWLLRTELPALPRGISAALAALA
jgi:aminoglycoside phosphotransferase (APT) family kinase protein